MPMYTEPGVRAEGDDLEGTDFNTHGGDGRNGRNGGDGGNYGAKSGSQVSPALDTDV